MLNATALIAAIMTEFEKKEGLTHNKIQEERRRLHGLSLPQLGVEYRKATATTQEPNGKDPYDLKAA